MKKTVITLCVMALLGATACNNSGTDKKAGDKDTSNVSAKDGKSDEADAPVDSATMAKAWEEYMAIGDMHKMMATWDGEWTSEMTMWMSPEAPPTKSTGTSVNKMIYNGHYQEAKYKASFEGMPFEGTSIMGYDNTKKKFVNTWIDNMGSGIMYMEGTWDDASKSINLTGTQIDPVTKKECQIRQVVKIVDANKQTMEMYTTKGGKEAKDMEIVYTRK